MASTHLDVSGVLVRPAQAGGASGASTPRSRPRRTRRAVIGVLAVAAIAGGIGAVAYVRGGRGGGGVPAAVIDPAAACAPHTAELDQLRAELAAEKKIADELRGEKKKLAAKAAEAAAATEKLAGVVGAQGQVTQHGDEITLELVDKVLFPVGQATLTPRGEKILAQVGAALNDVPDKQFWVQGHTDDTPIRGGKGAPPLFASNWELSAARALTVVHYLQDQAKVDPRRLAAVAFGEHRPASRSKAKNRRIEIVLYPTHQLAK